MEDKEDEDGDIPTRKIGAPPKRDPLPGERFTIATRVSPTLKRRLDAAAEESGRSQAQETELRLERSFDRTDLLTEVLTLAYDKEIAEDLIWIGKVMKARNYGRRSSSGHFVLKRIPAPDQLMRRRILETARFIPRVISAAIARKIRNEQGKHSPPRQT
jgi:hypothetical protein